MSRSRLVNIGGAFSHRDVVAAVRWIHGPGSVAFCSAPSSCAIPDGGPVKADGYLARRYAMRSVLGTILDPAADKILMTTLTVTLTMKALLPGKLCNASRCVFSTCTHLSAVVPLAVIILGRDVLLSLSAFYIRYTSLPAPVSVFYNLTRLTMLTPTENFFSLLGLFNTFCRGPSDECQQGMPNNEILTMVSNVVQGQHCSPTFVNGSDDGQSNHPS